MFGLFDHTTYSFLDLSGAISHPEVGSYVFTGQGVGKVTVGYQVDKTAHEIGVNGVVCLYRVPGNSGKLIIECHQTSNIHKWLLHAYAVLYAVRDGEEGEEGYDRLNKAWGKMNFVIRSITGGIHHYGKGVSFNKRPDMSYASEGGMVTWELLVAALSSRADNPSGAGGLSAIAKQFIS